VTRLETRGTEQFAVRIGIATGLVVVGDLVGEGSAQEQAVVGETPNLAARLQALAEPGQIILAGATRRRSAICSGCATSGARRSRASPSRSKPSRSKASPQ
jgi:class 3 adenylate cyclase